MATKKSTQLRAPEWRDVPAECMGEGTLTGHRLARNLIAFCSESPAEGRKKAGELMRLATLVSCANELDEYCAGRVWAATAFLDDVASYVVHASNNADYDAWFKLKAAEAAELIKRTSNLPRPVEELNSVAARRAKKTAKETVAKIMRKAM